MFFSEPPRSQGDIHFVLFGIPVRIHPLFWLAAVLLGLNQHLAHYSPLVPIALWVAAVLVSITVHELGHALMMRRYGYWPSIVLHAFGGLAIPLGGGRPGRLGQILISAAGPGAGFLLAAVLYLALRIAAGHGTRVGLAPIFGVPLLPVVFIEGQLLLSYFLDQVFWISVLWGLVNLLPVYPLDGGQIAQEVLVWANPRDGLRQSLVLSLVTAGVMVLLAITQWGDFYVAIFFGYMAYMSYMTLQAYNARRW